MLTMIYLRRINCSVLLSGLGASMLLSSQGYGSVEEVTTTVSEDSLIKNLRQQTQAVEDEEDPVGVTIERGQPDGNTPTPIPTPNPTPASPPPPRIVRATPSSSPPQKQPLPSITESFEATSTTAVSTRRPVEMLWALDNSSSMKDDIEGIRDNLKHFIDQIKNNNVDLSMTVITATTGKYGIPQSTFEDSGVRVVDKDMHSFDQLSMISAFLNPESWTAGYNQISIGDNDTEKCYVEGEGVISLSECKNTTKNAYVLLPIAYIPSKMNTYDFYKRYTRHWFNAGEKTDFTRLDPTLSRSGYKSLIYNKWDNGFFNPTNGKLKII